MTIYKISMNKNNIQNLINLINTKDDIEHHFL